MRLLPPPGRGRWRQMALLGITFTALVAVAWYQWGKAAPTAPTSNSPVQPVSSPEALRLPESLKLEQLDAVADKSDVGRNPFGFGVKPAPPPPPRPTIPVTPAPTPPPPVPQGPPAIALKYAGYVVVDSAGRTMVTLKDPASGAAFRAFEGDVVDGRYRIVKVTAQSVVVSYVDGSGQRSIPFGG